VEPRGELDRLPVPAPLDESIEVAQDLLEVPDIVVDAMRLGVPLENGRADGRQLREPPRPPIAKPTEVLRRAVHVRHHRGAR